MFVSFIIPHKGRKELLEQTIQSILNLDFDLNKIEIIVVTQNKTLNCDHVDLNHIRFKILFRPENDTISTLRNVGEYHAIGEYLVFLDADIQLSPNWLDVMFKELEAAPNRALVSAVQEIGPNAGIIEKIKTILNNAAADNPVEFLTGRNLFMPRKIFQGVGGFPEHLVTCEDYYFTNKVYQIGEVYYTSKASYIHLGEDQNYFEMFRKEIWRGQSNLQSLRGRKISLREIPSILMPVWQILFSLATIISAVSKEMLAMLFCLLMFWFPVFLYALRLYRISKNSVSFEDSLWFYSVYFSARIIGTVIGFFKIIRT